MARTGRPKIEMDWEEIGRMCEVHCTEEEIAHIVGVSLDTIARRCKKDLGMTFKDFSGQKRDFGKQKLRDAQLKMAMRNPTMAIWLGKQLLGQREPKAEVETRHSVDPTILSALKGSASDAWQSEDDE